jgi:ABC-2 type transport system ATP-binding protein
MSTGQRQRVKLAQAIVHDPLLVLLDEPTNGLDPAQREDMLALIRHVGHDLGMNVILSSHLLEEVERVSDAVVIIDRGTVVAKGTLAELEGGGEELMVTLDATTGSAEQLVAVLGAAGIAAHADGPLDVVVALERPVVYDIVRDAIADAGLGIRRLEARRANLEDVYLSASAERAS